jgi:small subunit ribosomal protein S21
LICNSRPLSGKGVTNSMAFVKTDENEPLEKAIKRFKRMVEKEGIIREWKSRQYFEKPSSIQNKLNKANERKQMKKVRKMHASKAY